MAIACQSKIIKRLQKEREKEGLSALAIPYYIFEQINLLKSFVSSCDRCVLLKRKPRFE